jgi:hypothetical protein
MGLLTSGCLLQYTSLMICILYDTSTVHSTHVSQLSLLVTVPLYSLPQPSVIFPSFNYSIHGLYDIKI